MGTKKPAGVAGKEGGEGRWEMRKILPLNQTFRGRVIIKVDCGSWLSRTIC